MAELDFFQVENEGSIKRIIHRTVVCTISYSEIAGSRNAAIEFGRIYGTNRDSNTRPKGTEQLPLGHMTLLILVVISK